MRISDWSSDVCSSDLPRWIVRDEGIEVDLNVRNIFPILDVIHDDMGSLSRSFAANHFEAAGEVKGEARIGGKRIAIDGLCYRDHSWGVRSWRAALRRIAGSRGRSEIGRAHV